MPSKATKRTRGRPRAEKIVPGDRPQLSFRITHDLMAKIGEARRLSGRSQSAEVEYRVERSFDRASLLDEVMELRYGKQLRQVLTSVASAILASDYDPAPLLIQGSVVAGDPTSRAFSIKIEFPESISPDAA